MYGFDNLALFTSEPQRQNKGMLLAWGMCGYLEGCKLSAKWMCFASNHAYLHTLEMLNNDINQDIFLKSLS
jgi:hypothetical protein